MAERKRHGIGVPPPITVTVVSAAVENPGVWCVQFSDGVEWVEEATDEADARQRAMADRRGDAFARATTAYIAPLDPRPSAGEARPHGRKGGERVTFEVTSFSLLPTPPDAPSPDPDPTPTLPIPPAPPAPPPLRLYVAPPPPPVRATVVPRARVPIPAPMPQRRASDRAEVPNVRGSLLLLAAVVSGALIALAALLGSITLALVASGLLPPIL